jgi:hypothetical protein
MTDLEATIAMVRINEQLPACETFRVFTSRQTARDYRYRSGCGGWIFAAEGDGFAVIFPPSMTPTAIFNHRMVKGMAGELFSNA